MNTAKLSLREKLLWHSATDQKTGCRLWVGSCFPNGYGHLQTREKAHLTHRLAYELFVGPIPEGLHICHRCDTPACINPAHLFPGTNRDNALDMVAKGRAPATTHPGARNPNAKITQEQAEQIVKAIGSCRQIAKQFGISASQVARIRSGRTKWGFGRSNSGDSP